MSMNKHIYVVICKKGIFLFDLCVDTIWQHTRKESNVIIQDNFDSFRREHITV